VRLGCGCSSLSSTGSVGESVACDSQTGFPALAVVPALSLLRMEHVVPDFEDLCDRLGLYATPATVPDSPHELPLQRFFVNAFFPWTGGGEEDQL